MSKRGGSADKRITGSKLQARRKRIYLASPCCVECGTLTRHPDGYQLDHIKPLHQGGTDTEDNLQLLCLPCHERKTAEEMGYTYRPKVTFGADGWPIE